MMMVAVMAATIWGIGWAMDVPVRARWVMLGVLLAAVMLVQVLLPAGHPLRAATGGDVRLWLLLLVGGLLVWLYRQGLRWLRARAGQSQPPAATDAPLNPTELDRYARHIVMREIGGPGQVALKRAQVLVVGAGGLGSPVLQYLAAAGVGTIGVIDDDVVDNANLQRQVIHLDAQIGAPKVQSAADAMRAQNPYVAVRAYHRRLDDGIAAELLADYDLVIDGSDNFDTRHLVNRAAVATGTPLVAGALTQWEGQVSIYDPARGGPCYHCVFPNVPAPALVPSCAEAGVLGPLPAVIGGIMAAEAVKLITGAGDPLRGRLMIYDAQYADARVIRSQPRADCAVCHGAGAAG